MQAMLQRPSLLGMLLEAPQQHSMDNSWRCKTGLGTKTKVHSMVELQAMVCCMVRLAVRQPCAMAQQQARLLCRPQLRMLLPARAVLNSATLAAACLMDQLLLMAPERQLLLLAAVAATPLLMLAVLLRPLVLC